MKILALLAVTVLGAVLFLSWPRPAANDIAERLNRRYQTLVPACDGGRPAFQCSGVVIRATQHYNLSPLHISNGFVAFSYLRRDAQVEALTTRGSVGIIVDGAGVVVRCVYPVDAASDARGGQGCGSVLSADLAIREHSRPCREQGVTALEQWIAYYQADVDYVGKGCSFSPDTTEFQLSIDIRAYMNRAYPLLAGWNELVVAPWQDAQASGLEAIYYQTFGYMKEEALKREIRQRAQWMQVDFFRQTGRVVPVVRLDLERGETQSIFSYSVDDQLLW